MAERKTLKSVSIDDVKPRVTLTPIVEVSGETCRIHHIKADSIAVDGRDTFVPLRHVSKQRRRIFELEDEIETLRVWLTDSSLLTDLSVKCELQAMDKLALRKQVRELEAENEKLRNLVRDTWEIASYSQCTPCKFFDTCDGCPCILRERIHELGIEV